MIDRYANVDIQFEGTVMVVRVETDPDKVDIQPSKSGKTLTVATTGGMTRVQGPGANFKLNLTLSKPA